MNAWASWKCEDWDFKRAEWALSIFLNLNKDRTAHTQFWKLNTEIINMGVSICRSVLRGAEKTDWGRDWGFYTWFHH